MHITTDKNNNQIIHDDPIDSILKNSKINFRGKNAICYIKKGATLQNCSITLANNAVAYLGKSTIAKFYLNLCNNTTLFLGDNIYFNPNTSQPDSNIIVSEHTNVMIGNDCLISSNIWFRTADPHLIYDINTTQRINHAKSIYIGDHVWIGFEVAFTKGAIVASGSTIGAKSLVTGYIPHNVSSGGVPAKIIKKDTFWVGHCTHDWDIETTEKFRENSSKNFIYNNQNSIDIDELEEKLKLAKTADKKLIILKEIANNTNKNRFTFKCGINSMNKPKISYFDKKDISYSLRILNSTKLTAIEYNGILKYYEQQNLYNNYENVLQNGLKEYPEDIGLNHRSVYFKAIQSIENKDFNTALIYINLLLKSDKNTCYDLNSDGLLLSKQQLCLSNINLQDSNNLLIPPKTITAKKYIFTFWEPHDGVPGYIQACMDTWAKFIPDYEVIVCNYENLKNLLPEELYHKTICKEMSYAAQSDCIRAVLVCLYGGLWLDADTIITNRDFFLQIEKNKLTMIGSKANKTLNNALIYSPSNSEIMKVWAKQVLERIVIYRIRDRVKFINKEFYDLIVRWDFFANGISHPLIQSLSDKDFNIIDRNEMKVFLEHPEKFEFKEVVNYYKNFYFKDTPFKEELRKNEGVVMLHNSWTPKEYMSLSKKEFLKQNITLAKILKNCYSIQKIKPLPTIFKILGNFRKITKIGGSILHFTAVHTQN